MPSTLYYIQYKYQKKYCFYGVYVAIRQAQREDDVERAVRLTQPLKFGSVLAARSDDFIGIKYNRFLDWVATGASMGLGIVPPSDSNVRRKIVLSRTLLSVEDLALFTGGSFILGGNGIERHFLDLSAALRDVPITYKKIKRASPEAAAIIQTVSSLSRAIDAEPGSFILEHME